MLTRECLAIATTCALATLTLAAPAAQAPAGGLHLTVADSGSRARYRVREQLAGVSFPNDAVGVTTAVSGGIVFDADGAVVPGESRVVVDVTGLTSDSSRRDGFIRQRLLGADEYPMVTLAPTAVTGLPWPLPSDGDVAFTLTGDLTVRDVTRPTTWEVTAQTGGNAITGTATTSFTFSDFELTKPTLAFLLSVDETIRLELDFRFVPAAPPAATRMPAE